ncbi:hypothetical protein MMC10_010043 [Thelotrema lepadinum]|nr:hypothetical protein [Thelotrema lepadinum]
MTCFSYFDFSNAFDLSTSKTNGNIRGYSESMDVFSKDILHHIPQFQGFDDLLGPSKPLHQLGGKSIGHENESKILARGNTRSRPDSGRTSTRLTRPFGNGKPRNRLECNSPPTDTKAPHSFIIQSCMDATQRAEEIMDGNKLILAQKGHEKLPLLYEAAALQSHKNCQKIGQQKDAQAFLKHAIQTANESRDFDYAEKLRYAAKKYAKAWGKLHAQVLGIDRKNKANKGPVYPLSRASDDSYHLHLLTHEFESDEPSKSNDISEITVADRPHSLHEQQTQCHSGNHKLRARAFHENQVPNCAAAFAARNENEGTSRRTRHQILARGIAQSKPEGTSTNDQLRTSRSRSRLGTKKRPLNSQAEAAKSTSSKEEVYPLDDPTECSNFLEKETERFRNLRIANNSVLKEKRPQSLKRLRTQAGIRCLRQNQCVGEVKDIHKAIRTTIANRYKAGKPDEAENLKYKLKQFGSAWGQHHRLLIGIDRQDKREIRQYLGKVFGDVNKQLFQGYKPPGYKSPEYKVQPQKAQDPDSKSTVRPAPSLAQKRQRLENQRSASRSSMSKLPTIPERAKHAHIPWKELEMYEARSSLNPWRQPSGAFRPKV